MGNLKQKTLIIIALVISIILLFSSIQSLSATTQTFGQKTIGNFTAWQSAGVIVGSRFIASGGTPNSISAYIIQPSGFSNIAKCAIYSESNKLLLMETEEKILPAGFNGWITFNIGAYKSLTSGSTYSIAIWFKDWHSSIRYSSGSDAQSWYIIQPYTGSFPKGPYNSLSPYGQENTVYSIFCTYESTLIASPAPLSSASSTPSPFTQETSSNTIGQTVKGSNYAWQPANVMVGSRFTAQETGILNSINAYIGNIAAESNNVKCAVYSETNKVLVGSSKELTISGKSSGWFSFEIMTSAKIIAGQRYSIVVWFKNANSYVTYATGTSSQSWYNHVSYSNFPETYSTNGQENNVYSVYAIVSTETTSFSPSATVLPIPTPSPTLKPKTTPIPSSPNLAPILGTWGDYNLYGNVYYGSITSPQITSADFSVTHNGNPSIRISGSANSLNRYREVNNKWISVKPGDHVVFKCWVKTNPSTISGYGAIIGFDVWGPYDRLMEGHPRNPQSGIWNYPQTGTAIFVPYGSDWTQQTIDVIIPSTFYSHDFDGKTVTPQQICYIAPWLGGSWGNGESAAVWFADAEIYLNP